MSADPAKLERNAIRGAEAASMLEHPLFKELFADMAEKTTAEMLKLPVADHDERLALCTVLRVLRGMPAMLQQVASDGAFDAKTLAQIREKKTDA
jgi:hypothetical protein